MNRILLLATLGLGVMLSGCATMNKDECLTANWRDIGHEDGMKGESRTRIGEHRQACAKFKVTPDSQAYSAGYEEGIRMFCVPSNGLTVGQSGRGYNPQSCPPDMEPAFLRQYNYGHQVYTVRSQIDSAQNDLRNREALLEKEQDTRKRYDLRDEISSLDRKLRTLRSEEEELVRRGPPQ